MGRAGKTLRPRKSDTAGRTLRNLANVVEAISWFRILVSKVEPQTRNPKPLLGWRQEDDTDNQTAVIEPWILKAVPLPSSPQIQPQTMKPEPPSRN